MSKFLAKRLSSLKEYVPGEQPGDMQYIKLNTNESPYPPSTGVFAAMTDDEITKLNLYPSPDGTALIDAIAGLYGVTSENVIIGNGSDELLAFAFLAFCDGGAAFPDITYGFYPVYAKLYGIEALEIPLNDDFTIDPADYFNLGRAIFIANPNAPTGLALGLEQIEAILKNNPDNVVVIDEAYVDFGAESAIGLTHRYDNLIVMHTYSKARSMAGARLAYAIAQKPLIDDLNKMKYSFNPYNVNRLTQVMGIAAIKDDAYYKENCRKIAETRDYTAARLKALGFSVTDSRANFIFAQHSAISGAKLYSMLKEKGILIRHLNKPRIADYLRITVGTREDMDKTLDAIESVLGGLE